ncbi:hypothetical protein PV726_31820 [Streptomyces europaeiscabiei]|uniref:hypothetical protein n=1 Tax=Streptomyces europaeiscabiei TaxID=146819 RepID=UPI0029A2B4E7|nr:hypothetical protein [Streptomyces europaeiscabiei]MDX3694843.1 hypothetical protein [Streptomyces europaeiscabiei]
MLDASSSMPSHPEVTAHLRSLVQQPDEAIPPSNDAGVTRLHTRRGLRLLQEVPADRPAVRHTASTITDDDLDGLYRRLELLEAELAELRRSPRAGTGTTST